MLKALGTKLILRPCPAPSRTESGLFVSHTGQDPVIDHRYFVVSAGPRVEITGLKHGGVVLCTGYTGQSFDYEGHPLRVVDQSEVLMVL